MTYSHSNLILYLYVLIRKLFLLTSLLILFVSACQCAYACTYQNLAFYLEFNIFHRKHIFFFFQFPKQFCLFSCLVNGIAIYLHSQGRSLDISSLLTMIYSVFPISYHVLYPFDPVHYQAGLCSMPIATVLAQAFTAVPTNDI